MSTIAKEWLKAACDDLMVITEIQTNPHLTHMVAFHAQQAIEKSFKALLEFHRQHIPKKHDLISLYFEIESYYIDSRYPGSFGLLPNGKPSQKEAFEFFFCCKRDF